MYSLLPRHCALGLGDGVSTYYSPNCTMEDAKFVQGFLDQEGISPENTRLIREGNKSEGDNDFPPPKFSDAIVGRSYCVARATMRLEAEAVLSI